jgi:hypothetical protein
VFEAVNHRQWRSVKYGEVYLKAYRNEREAQNALVDNCHFYNTVAHTKCRPQNAGDGVRFRPPGQTHCRADNTKRPKEDSRTPS